MIKKPLIFLTSLLITFQLFAYTHQLPVPKNLIAFNATPGIKLLETSKHKTAFWHLMPYFTTEQGLTFCGIASSVITLNALGIQPPLSPTHTPYDIFE